jgi:subtilisin family serine protease
MVAWPKHRRSSLVAFILLASMLGSSVLSPGAVSGTGPETVSYLVQKTSARGHAEQLALSLGGRITDHLPVIDAFVVELPANQASRLAASPDVRRLQLNSQVHSSGNGKSRSSKEKEKPAGRKAPATDYPMLVKADQVWPERGGVTVAVLDTGLTPRFPELEQGLHGRPRLLASVETTEPGRRGRDRQGDLNGHGTHVAGIIANSARPEGGAYAGSAPDVNLVSVRVLGADGSGTYARSSPASNGC